MTRFLLLAQTFVVAALLLGSGAATAQEQTQATTQLQAPADAPLPGLVIPGGNSVKDDAFDKTMALLNQLPEKERDDILKESETSEQYCKSNNLLGNFYDCSCFALQVVDQRIKKGPDYPYANLIMDSDYKKCVFTPAIAGFGYDRCFNVIYMDTLTDDQVKKLCGCVGRTMAGNFASRPVPDADYTDRMFMDSMTACRRASSYQ